MENLVTSFWKDKSVLLTGHTGFKGAWAALWLEQLGAHVTAVALNPEPEMRFFDALAPLPHVTSHLCDIRDRAALTELVHRAQPDIVLHMAAQSLVRRSYAEPIDTFETNILGTAHLLQACLTSPTEPQAVLVITSDKVYANHDQGTAFVESDPLGGDDPYSASKACTELITQSFRKSFYMQRNIPLATARAGNVIGGGDWSEDRLIPDLIRSLEHHTPFTLRNPQSTRPWQHVLDVLSGYFAYAQALAERSDIPPALNFGPTDSAPVDAHTIVKKFEHYLQRPISIHMPEMSDREAWSEKLPEKKLLAMNAELAATTLGWRPKFSTDQAVQWTAEWYHHFLSGHDMRAYSLEQIQQYSTILTKP